MVANDLKHWLVGLDQNADIFPHQIDLLSDKVLLVRLSPQDIRQASFLDQRVLTAQTQGAWLPWQDIVQAAPPAIASPVHFIFHVGHCGSTLISRLLQMAPSVAGLREPLPLRTFAMEQLERRNNASFWSESEASARLKTMTALWARGPNTKVIKATSMCTGLIQSIKDALPNAQGLFLYLKPEIYLATLLGGANAFADLRGFAQMRIRRLNSMLDTNIDLAPLSLGELAAMSWLCEMLSARLEATNNLLTLDFDDFLKTPADALRNIAAHFNVSWSDREIETALNSPVMRQYSKAPDHAYDASVRTQILTESRQTHGDEINAGLRWLNRTCKQHPSLNELHADKLQTGNIFD